MQLTGPRIIVLGCRRLVLTLAALMTLTVRAQSGAEMTIQAGQSGALTANEMAATQVLGPNQLLSAASPALSASASGGSLTLSWPVASADFTILTTTNPAAGNWMTVVATPQLVDSQWQVVLPIAGNAQFYRLQK